MIACDNAGPLSVTSTTTPAFCIHATAGELLRITGQGDILVDGHRASDFEIATAMRAFAARYAEEMKGRQG